MADLRYWLWLSTRSGLRPADVLRYVEHFGSVKALYLASDSELKRVKDAKPQEIDALSRKGIGEAEEIADRCAALGIRILCLRDADYPDRLRSIDDPPLILYVRGQLPDLDDSISIGIVGTRRASRSGLRTAERIGGELGRFGTVVVTGLAEGIDSAAAVGALREGGSVIGVLGTGVDMVYPADHRDLQTAVGERGALVSEYPPGVGAARHHFPRRNRIISGLSLGVTVVEAPIRSGSLITAGFARDQGRDVFVIPGAVDDPSYAGSLALIRDGAQMVRGGRDILMEYQNRYPRQLWARRTADAPIPVPEPDAAKRKHVRVGAKKPIDIPETVGYHALEAQLSALTEAELKIVRVLAGGRVYTDELVRRSTLSASEVFEAVTLLELRGYVEEADSQYRLLVQVAETGEA